MRSGAVAKGCLLAAGVWLHACQPAREARGDLARVALLLERSESAEAAQVLAALPDAHTAPARVLRAEQFILERRDKEALGELAQVEETKLDAAARRRARMMTLLAKCRLDEEPERQEKELHALAGDAGLEKDASTAIRAHIFRGTCLLQSERWEDATTAYRRGADEARLFGKAHLETLAYIGLAYVAMQQRRYDECQRDAGWAAAAAEGAQLKRQRLMALDNQGVCYLDIGDYANARALMQRAKALTREVKNESDERRLLLNLGLLAFHTNDAENAVTDLNAALPMAERAQHWEDVGQAVLRLAQLALARGDPAGAHRLLDRLPAAEPKLRVERALIQGLVAEHQGRPADAAGAFAAAAKGAPENPALGQEAFQGLARAQATLGQFEAAAQSYQRAIQLVESESWQNLGTQSRLSFRAAFDALYHDYVRFHVNRSDRQAAFLAAERARAVDLSRRVERAAPNPTVAPLFRGSQRAALTYWLGARESYLWVTTAQGTRFHLLPDRERIERLIDLHQAAINDGRDPVGESLAASRELFDLLVRPVLADLQGRTQILLSLDGALHRLNFETLVTPENRFWLEDVELVLVPGLAAVTTVTRPRREPRLLAIGDPIEAPPEFPRLPMAAAEIDAVAAHFAKRTVLMREAATPLAFAATQPASFTHVHFAAHAVSNSVSPLDSAVVLSGAPYHRLYARDVLGSKLSADLVTLSACQSGNGRVYRAEGPVGLTWAFLAAGADRVVSALWDVDDAASARLMRNLYRRIGGGQAPAAALRAAKLELLREGRAWTRPYYWGAFVLTTRVLP